jgi:hypothetical protein
MANKKYIVSLTLDERARLDSIAHSYRHSARERTRAKVLLLADTNQEGGGHTDTQIADTVGIKPLCVSHIRQRAITRGVLPALEHKPQENRKPRRLDGNAEAQLITIACSQAPDGRKRWTMQLLKEKLIQMQVVESIDTATICRTLKKMRSNRG